MHGLLQYQAIETTSLFRNLRQSEENIGQRMHHLFIAVESYVLQSHLVYFLTSLQAVVLLPSHYLEKQDLHLAVAETPNLMNLIVFVNWMC